MPRKTATPTQATPAKKPTRRAAAKPSARGSRKPKPEVLPVDELVAEDAGQPQEADSVEALEEPAQPAEADGPEPPSEESLGEGSPAPARIAPPRPGQLAGLSLTEEFLIVAVEDGWDDRVERRDALGPALAGAMLLELALPGGLKAMRDQYVLADSPTEGHPGLAAVAQAVRADAGRPSLDATGRLARRVPELLQPWKESLQRRGLVAVESWRHLGLFRRSSLSVADPGAVERARDRIVRALAGGGQPDAQTIVLLGLVEAAGLLGRLVPSPAVEFNRKRIHALVAGRDTLDYKVDGSLRRIQDLALRTVLTNVRALSGGGPA